MKYLISILIILASFSSFSQENPSLKNPPPHNPAYPAHWWAMVEDKDKPSWEILPQEAQYGEVILSKRNELGLLSNFAPTPFVYHGKNYGSMEGFWQATKYPEDSDDPRSRLGFLWPHTRAEVAAMVAFEAKKAGDAASAIMKILGIDWVSYGNIRMVYKRPGYSSFYFTIVDAMKAKLEQNPEVQKVLLQTGDLVLRPDHKAGPKELKAWQYFDIWMMLREDLKRID